MRLASALFLLSSLFACSKHDENNTTPAPSASAESTPATEDSANPLEWRHRHHHDGGFGRWRREHGMDAPGASGAASSAPAPSASAP